MEPHLCFKHRFILTLSDMDHAAARRRAQKNVSDQ